MEIQGQILATMGSTNAAMVVSWDGLTRDEVLDALEAVMDFVVGDYKSQYTVAGLRSEQDVRVRSFTVRRQDVVADLDSDEESW